MKKLVILMMTLISVGNASSQEDYESRMPKYSSLLVELYGIDDYEMKSISHIVLYNSYRFGLDANLVLSIIAVESNFKKNVNSYLGSKYGRGLMQVSEIVLTEYNWTNYKNTKKVSDLYDPIHNIEVGCWYLARLRDHYGIKGLSDWLSAYNSGPYGGLQTKYVGKVLTLMLRSFDA